MSVGYEDLSTLSQEEKEARVSRLLSEQVPDDQLSTREAGRGEVLTYIKSDSYLIGEFNRIFGECGWSDDTEYVSPVDNSKLTWKSKCKITAEIGNKVVTRTGEGACSVMSSKNVSLENIEMAIKGAATDAFKRAARKFGRRMGAGLGQDDLERALAANSSAPPEDRQAPRPAAAQGYNNRPPQQRDSGDNRPASGGGHGGGAKGESCPNCSGPMWDERKSSRYGNGLAASGRPKPIFKCKDKNCNGAIWPSKKALEEYQANLYSQEQKQDDWHEQGETKTRDAYERPIADLARTAFGAEDVGPGDGYDPFDDD